MRILHCLALFALAFSITAYARSSGSNHQHTDSNNSKSKKQLLSAIEALTLCRDTVQEVADFFSKFSDATSSLGQYLDNFLRDVTTILLENRDSLDSALVQLNLLVADSLKEFQQFLLQHASSLKTLSKHAPQELERLVVFLHENPTTIQTAVRKASESTLKLLDNFSEFLLLHRETFSEFKRNLTSLNIEELSGIYFDRISSTLPVFSANISSQFQHLLQKHKPTIDHVGVRLLDFTISVRKNPAMFSDAIATVDRAVGTAESLLTANPRVLSKTVNEHLLAASKTLATVSSSEIQLTLIKSLKHISGATLSALAFTSQPQELKLFAENFDNFMDTMKSLSFMLSTEDRLLLGIVDSHRDLVQPLLQHLASNPGVLTNCLNNINSVVDNLLMLLQSNPSAVKELTDFLVIGLENAQAFMKENSHVVDISAKEVVEFARSNLLLLKDYFLANTNSVIEALEATHKFIRMLSHSPHVFTDVLHEVLTEFTLELMNTAAELISELSGTAHSLRDLLLPFADFDTLNDAIETSKMMFPPTPLALADAVQALRLHLSHSFNSDNEGSSELQGESFHDFLNSLAIYYNGVLATYTFAYDHYDTVNFYSELFTSLFPENSTSHRFAEEESAPFNSQYRDEQFDNLEEEM